MSCTQRWKKHRALARAT